jgi:hypothetical protein
LRYDKQFIGQEENEEEQNEEDEDEGEDEESDEFADQYRVVPCRNKTMLGISTRQSTTMYRLSRSRQLPTP